MCTNPSGHKVDSSIDITTCEGVDIGNYGGELMCPRPPSDTSSAGAATDPAAGLEDAVADDGSAHQDRHEL
eukprot:m.443618 g.443618  ORF g.443618 m.443618 type:complete len:71 (-) comp18984_c0_seq1:202-414(-)